MKKRVISLALTLCMLICLLPSLASPVSAAGSGTEMNALTALGIDTSKAPEGFDPTSLDNPYGRNTIELSPVYELYKVGLSTKTEGSASYETAGELQNGRTTDAPYDTVYNNSLTSRLYGDEAWDATTVDGILGSVNTSTIADGTTTVKGKYTLISTGEVYTLGTTPTTTSAYLNDADNIPANGYLKEAVNASTDLGNGFKYALSSVAAGNFNGNTGGLSAQTVMVYTSEYSTNGGLYLRFGSAKSGTYGSSAKELLSTTKQIGNPTLTYEDKLVENFAEAPYQLQNYLQVTTGDWNGDGLDEVAVYIPEKGNSRIAVYALQLIGGDNPETAYLNPGKWSLVWTYYLREGDVVSNMVSLVSGDVNMDGTDDLAATWGYYYGPTQNVGSKAVVMFGAKGTAMLTASQQFDLTYGSSNIVRASFDFGDMAGSDEDVLILCGQSDADLKLGNTQTRYVALYSWNGTAFESNIYQNFDLFAQEDSSYVWAAMTLLRSSDSEGNFHFYSLPLCTANTGVISQGISGGGDLLYFDSLIIEYTEDGLNIKEAWDVTGAMQQNIAHPVEYVEYGAVAGDLTGQTGKGALVTMTQTLKSSEKITATYTFTGSHEEPKYVWDYYYQNWLYKLFGIKTWYLKFDRFQTVTDSGPVNVDYEQLTMGETYMVAADPTGYHSRTAADFSTAICLANTDNDSSYMNYGGRHYYTYTDPKVLSVLASPPYFKDLIGRDDLSGNYAESTTSYSSTSGSGSGYNASATISIGAYVSFEQEISVFGVTVASTEVEATFTANFTFETESISMLEQTVTYSAAAGEDMVAFYSIPMEIYEYTSYVPDGRGNYKEVLTTVNIPHEAAVRLLSLDEYEAIAKDYKVLPSIADNVLTHVLGDPSSYPASTDGYRVIAAYNGTPSAVGFSSTGGGSGISQEISMSKETSTSFSASAAVEGKAGAGAGGLTVGVVAGAEAGAGYVTVTTNGSSFSGEMQNMPIEAQPYGYGMNWRIFCYEYKNKGISFPVVSYIVSDVHSPAPLPDDFEQDIARTTDEAVTLRWSYDKMVAGFKIYRYYEFPDGSGSYEVAFVPFTDGRPDSTTGAYNFSYTDEGLSPYTEYQYQIQTVTASDPKESIYSEPMSCRTKTKVGYPIMSYSGLNENGQLPIYPDSVGTVTLNVASPESYSGLSYQWQKLVDGNWTTLSGKTTASLTIANAGSADNAAYRCRVNCIYYDSSTAENYYISAYSDAITTAYTKRTPAVNIFTATEQTTGLSKGLNANIELYSANAGNAAAPTGSVVFTVEGTDYRVSKTVPLVVSDDTKLFGDEQTGMRKYYSTAPLSITSLPEGVYTVSAYYSGSFVFKDLETQTGVLVVVGNGSAHRLSLSKEGAAGAVTGFDYGDAILLSVQSISKDLNDEIQAVPVPGATYKYYSNNPADWADDPATTAVDIGPVRVPFAAGSVTPYIGSYTMEAYDGDDLIAEQVFTVSKKQITVGVHSREDISTSAVEDIENKPVIFCHDLTDSQLAALKLTYAAVNSAGNPVVLNNSTDPGNYTVTACTGPDTPVALYNNYSVTYVSGSYGIVGAKYRLTAVAAPYSETGPSGARPVGTVGIANSTQLIADYAAGTAVMLYAAPQAGYEIDTWTAAFASGDQDRQTGGSTFPLTMEAQNVTVTVTFKPATIRLSTAVQPAAGGSITCSDPIFSSGAYVSYGAEYTFTATPKPGYHFSKWQTTAGGATTTPTGTPGAGGSSSLDVTMGTSSMTVYAVFERDAYTLTLEGDIAASYMYDDDGDSTTPLVKRNIPSGSPVTGDTAVTLEPKDGYQAAEGAVFIVNGTATTSSDSYTFNITQNTTASLETVQNHYAVTVTAVNGAVTTVVGGTPTDPDALADIPGGSSLTFTATADRGFVFDHWERDGDVVPGSARTLTIAALGKDTHIVAVFTPNIAYTAAASVSAPARGTMKYTLRDIYGALVGSADTVFPEGGLTVYNGESLVLSVSVVSGSMMEQWYVNGVSTYDTVKTYTLSNISGNINAVAYLKAASSYMVNFGPMPIDITGGTLTAANAGNAITSGSLQFGGSTLVFSAAPLTGNMLSKWTIQEGTGTETDVVDENGDLVAEPVYTIASLTKNLTVRAYFTPLVTNTVTLPAAVTGVSRIVYVTPIMPDDDGARDVTDESVRLGGTVRMTFEPKDGFGTSVEKIKSVLESAAGDEAVVSVTEDGGLYTAKVSNVRQAITLTEDQIYKQHYSITVPTGVTASHTTAVEEEIVTLTVTPAGGYALESLSLDNGFLIEEVSASLLVYTFRMPADNVEVSVSFTYIGGGGDFGGGGGISAPENEVPVPASGSGSDLDISAVIEDGIARLKIDADTLAAIRSMSGTLSLDLSALDASGVTFSADAFGAIAGADGIGKLSISLPEASLTFDSSALAAIGSYDGDITISAAMADPDSLTDEQAALVGGRPVLDLMLTAGGQTVSEFGTGTVEVKVPYSLGAGEDPNAVVIWYLNDDGVLEPVTGRYDAASAGVVFTVDHFSKYVVGLLPFKDVGREKWYFNSVSFAYANKLFSGIEDTVFAPDAAMTRAMLVTVLWRFEGKPTAGASAFTDVKDGEWYTTAVAWAAEKGIVSGYGNGLFGTGDAITREQMALLLKNYAAYKGIDVSATNDLGGFADGGSISSWAKAAMQWANAKGYVNGADGKLEPKGIATRSQVAAILQRFILDDAK